MDPQELMTLTDPESFMDPLFPADSMPGWQRGLRPGCRSARRAQPDTLSAENSMAPMGLMYPLFPLTLMAFALDVVSETTNSKGFNGSVFSWSGTCE